MDTSAAAVVEREARWRAPAAAASLLGVALIFASGLFSQVSGDGNAELLRSVHEHGGSVTLTGIAQGLGFALLAVPVLYLFRAAAARAPQVRRQLVGLVVAAPLFLALSAGLSSQARQEAADAFVSGKAEPTLTRAEAKRECAAERRDDGARSFAEDYEPQAGESALAACEGRKLADDAAGNAIGEASLASLVVGLGIAGGIGFAVAMFYTCLWAMRGGLLSRFWGSLGMALGIATIIGLIFFTFIWFGYFGLMLLGVLPGGRPPAWDEGRAVPWPTPGEKAANELHQENLPEDIEVDAQRVGDDAGPLSGGAGGGESAGPPRKRKRRGGGE